MSDAEREVIFKEWLKHHKGVLFKITRAYANSSEDRDDLFQEITLQVWRSVPNFRGESAVTTWLYRIALNTALRWRSKENRQPASAQSHTGNLNLIRQDSDYKNDRIEWLYEQIGKLNEIDRSLCLMVLDELSYQEMASILGITESNVAVKIHRIKKYLSEQSKINEP